MANLHRGEVAFDEAGQGYVLRVTNGDLAAFQNLWGDEYFAHIINGIDRHDMKVLSEVMKISMRKDDGTPAAFNLHLFNSMPLKQVSERVADALFYAVHGCSFVGYFEELSRKATSTEDPR